MDAVHSALADWHISSGRVDKAVGQAAAIISNEQRDSFLVRMVRICAADDPCLASETLLLVEAETLRAVVARELATVPGFFASEENTHRLIASIGVEPSDVAWMVEQVSRQNQESQFLKVLDEALGMDAPVLSRWRIAQIEKLLADGESRHRARFGGGPP